ncbi:MAG TPA: glycosyl hydrolase family 65 protein, partial [Enterococcus sp.]|nr:glycosyl hydrolase family 65 protein [Enterococcus sp.]
YRDIQGGTTAEGIHAGVMAATLFIPLTTFAGLDIRKAMISFEPNLPAAWNAITFNLTIRGIHLHVTATKTALQVTADQATTIEVNGQPIELTANKQATINY